MGVVGQGRLRVGGRCKHGMPAPRRVPRAARHQPEPSLRLSPKPKSTQPTEASKPTHLGVLAFQDLDARAHNLELLSHIHPQHVLDRRRHKVQLLGPRLNGARNLNARDGGRGRGMGGWVRWATRSRTGAGPRATSAASPLRPHARALPPSASRAVRPPLCSAALRSASPAPRGRGSRGRGHRRIAWRPAGRARRRAPPGRCRGAARRRPPAPAGRRGRGGGAALKQRRCALSAGDGQLARAA